MHNACHKFAFRVAVGYALAVDDALCRSREVAPHSVERIFNFADFIEGYGCTCVAFNTAGSLALLVVATEALGQDVGRYQYVAHLHDGKKLFQF